MIIPKIRCKRCGLVISEPRACSHTGGEYICAPEGTAINPPESALPEGALVIAPFEEFASAIIGACEVNGNLVVAYSAEAVIDVLAKQFKESEDLSEDDEDELWMAAQEYFSYNIEGAYMGPMTPCYFFCGVDIEHDDEG